MVPYKSVILVLLISLLDFYNCGLTLTKPCGQITCAEMQFCSKYGNICKDCSDVCDLQSHNMDMEACHQLCQDYLHNQQFVKRSESARDASRLEELSRDVRTLKVVAWLSMAFSGLSVVLLLGLCVSKVSRARRRHGGLAAMLRNTFHAFKGPEKAKAEKEKNHVVRVDTSNLKLDIPSPPLSHSSPNTASTTLPSTPPSRYNTKQRSPSEDATLDYAYDNPGLTPSPTLVKGGDDPKARETNF